ncbi:MAG: PaaI family thioesterase [Thermodesulfobacteriota bacterium]
MIREIENVFIDFPDNNCFACHPNNKHGLQLRFFADDEKQEVFTKVRPKDYMAGFPGILHGGVQCALVDEIAFWTMFDKVGKIGLTTKVEINYNKKVQSGIELEIRGKVTKVRGRYVFVDAVILDEDGEKCTSSTISYFLPKKEVVFDVLGKERFNEKFLDYIFD